MEYLVNFKEDKVFICNNKNGWKEVTKDIRYFNDYHNSYNITFKNGEKYFFSYSNVIILYNAKKIEIDPFLLGRFFCVDEAYLYKDENSYYFFNNIKGIKKIPDDIIDKLVIYKKSKQILYSYYSSLAKLYDKETQNDFLEGQYEKIKDLWLSDNVLYDLLETRLYSQEVKQIIYPFSHNNSQINAITKGIENNISIIQGPPGTGKTQTILNLIANILINGKTVAVISNNNKAVYNVYEKMKEYGYGFLCARLGNNENRTSFFSDTQDTIPDFNIKPINGDLNKLIEFEKEVFDCEANLSNEICEKENLEQQFKKYSWNSDIKYINIKNTIAPNEILKLAVDLESNGKDQIGFIKRLILKIKYGIDLKLTKNDIPELTENLKFTYIKKKINLLNQMIEDSKEIIRDYKSRGISEAIIKLSTNKFNKYLKDKMANLEEKVFTADNFKKNFSSFIKRYPVILSSTYCLPSSVPSWFSFDYIIIDEASQSTITTILPSLAKGKKLIVIGDEKQLPPVVAEELLNSEYYLAKEFNISQKMRNCGVSFLSFVQTLLENKVQKTLLKEHYRCPKQIIDFSNKRIYDNQLELKKNDDGVNHIKVIKTVPGNHARKSDDGSSGQYNQREIDEIVKLISTLPSNKTIGVITPYRRQSELLRKILPEYVEVGTIHTFQGREQQIIIFSTVANSAEDIIKDDEIIKSFVNNEQLINVALTRAKEQFILVTSDKIANSNKGILADLVKYIRYETNEDATNGNVTSVFDILYDDYSAIRKETLKTDEIATEEIIENLIRKIFKREEYSSLSYSTHVNLKSVVKIDTSKYNNDELKYLLHPWTHLDFVIYNKYDKAPILAIEVDGISYHEQSEKQSQHDLIKNKCLNDAELPLIRLKTNGANEGMKIVDSLNSILNK